MIELVVAKEDSSVSTVTQRCEAVRLIDHTGIVKDHSVENECTFLKSVLPERKGGRDEYLCRFHPLLNSLIRGSVIFPGHFQRILVVQVFPHH